MDLVAALRSRLAEVRDPELNASIVELGMVGTIEVDPPRPRPHRRRLDDGVLSAPRDY